MIEMTASRINLPSRLKAGHMPGGEGRRRGKRSHDARDVYKDENRKGKLPDMIRDSHSGGAVLKGPGGALERRGTRGIEESPSATS